MAATSTPGDEVPSLNGFDRRAHLVAEQIQIVALGLLWLPARHRMRGLRYALPHSAGADRCSFGQYEDGQNVEAGLPLRLANLAAYDFQSAG